MRPAIDTAPSLPGARHRATNRAAVPRGIRPYLVAPLLLLLGTLPALRALGALGLAPLASWHGAARHALALMFVFTGVSHFLTRTRASLLRMIPGWVPFPGLALAATGGLQVVGAAGLLLPATAPLAARCLAALLVALFPANVEAARKQVAIGDKPATPLGFRALVQVLFVALLLWSTSRAAARG